MKKLLARIPVVARRRAHAQDEHRAHMRYLAALRRAGWEQRNDPEMVAVVRRYAERVPAGSVGRHRLPQLSGN